MHRVAGATEPASYAWTLVPARTWSVTLRVFRGVAASVWEVAPAAATRSQQAAVTTVTAPSMTIATPGALGLLLAITDSNTTSHSSPRAEHQESRWSGEARTPP